MTAMRFPSLASWSAWARPWLLRIAADPAFSLDRSAIVARARLPHLSASYLASLGVKARAELTAEQVLRLAGVEGLAEQTHTNGRAK